MPSKNPRINFDIVDDMPEPTIMEEVMGSLNADESVDAVDEPITMPKVIKKPRPARTDIFDIKEPEAIKEPIEEPIESEEEEELVDEPDEPEPVEPEPEPEPVKVKPTGKLTKKGVPRKPMSDDHKEKLKLARIKAAEGRRRAAAERKANRDIETEEKNLIKQKRVKDLQKLKDEVNDVPTRPNRSFGVTAFTKEDLERAQYDAILKYDKLRKSEKAQKKKLQLEENQRKELMQKLQPTNVGYRSTNTNGKLSNKYDFCY
tara:strand:+ start:7063 stop:7842 length:780 start_codon:yes stop_codon:yes gene_type:complete